MDPSQRAVALITEHRHDPSSKAALQDLMDRANTEDVDELWAVIAELGETVFCTLGFAAYFMRKLDATEPAMSADEQLRHFAARIQGGEAATSGNP